MSEQLLLQRKVQGYFAELKAKNPAYSLRSFSRKLGVNSGVLSSILAGKRRISPKFAAQVAEKLSLDPQERDELLSLSKNMDNRRSPGEADTLQLSADQFHVISEWHHFAILSLLNTVGFQNEPNWIAARLGLPVRTVEGALQKLKRLGMLIEDEQKTLSRGAAKYRISDEIAAIATRKSQAQILQLAQASLENDLKELRDFSTMTFAIDLEKLTEAKAAIRRCQEELGKIADSGEKREIYKFCAQLFPLTKQI